MSESTNGKPQAIGNDGEMNFQKFSRSIYSIRAISIIGIFMYHFGAWTAFGWNPGLQYNPNLFVRLFFDIGEMGVDFFAFLSSMFLTINLVSEGREKHSWGKWYKKRILRIYPPMWFSVIIILPIDYLFSGASYSVNSIFVQLGALGGFVNNIIVGYDWFLTFILFCYLILPLFYLGMEKNFKLMASIIIVAFIILIFAYYPFAIAFPSSIDVYLSIHRFFDFFFGIIFGYWIGMDDKKNLRYFRDKRLGIASLFAVITTISLYVYFASLKFHYVGNMYHERLVMFALMTVSLILFFIYFLSKYENINRPFNLAGKISYEAYLIHLTPWQISIYVLFILFSLPYYLFFVELVTFIILAFVFAYPMNLFNNKIRKIKKLEIPIIILAISFMIYTFVQYGINTTSNLLEVNHLMALIIYMSLLLTVILSYFVFKFLKKKFFDGKSIVFIQLE
ncbi:MAG: acyltransferase family protein [Candidatus Helarchaeota archaeon]